MSTHILLKIQAEQHLQRLLEGTPTHNMFEVALARKHLVAQPLEILEQLVCETRDPYIRVVLFEVILEQGTPQATECAFLHAIDPAELLEVQTAIFRAIYRVRPPILGQSTMERFLAAFESIVLERVPYHLPLIRAMLGVLDLYRTYTPTKHALDLLENLVVHYQAPIRSIALLLIGFFGEIDTVERLCMLPAPDPRDQEAFNEAIHQILCRPINIALLQPKNFEHLVCRLLERMGCQHVEKSRDTKDDGVDIIVKSPIKQEFLQRLGLTEGNGGNVGEVKYLFVQCKRYEPSTQIKRNELTEFSTSVFSHSLDVESVAALFVTTTNKFSEGAERYISTGRWACPKKVVRGDELLRLLHQYIPEAKYCIDVPLKDRRMERNQVLFKELEIDDV